MPSRGTSVQRGYTWAHRQARTAHLAALVDGQPCARCQQPMYRSDAAHLDLDHTDDRQSYRGLAHRSCNRRAGRQARTTPARQPTTSTTNQRTPRSRNW